MKKIICTLAVAVTVAFLGFGCGHDHSVNTSKLESSFASADASLKSSVDKAVAAIKAEKWSEAIAHLQTVAKDAKLTDEQKKVCADILAQCQKALSEHGTKAAEDVKKALPGQ
jgi:hypothetical protein